MDRAYTKERELVESEEPAELQTDEVLETPDENDEIIIDDGSGYGAPVRIGLAAAASGDNLPNSPTSASYLQNAYGNIASLRLLHQNASRPSLLRSNPPLDKYEREADQMAAFAFRPQAHRPNLSVSRLQVQRFPVGGSSESQTAVPEAVPANAHAADEETVTSPPPSPGLIVEDSASQISAEQMTKSQFLAQLRTEVCATVESALAGTIWSAVGCPWIEHWFSYYQNRSAEQVERAIRRYVPVSAELTAAREYMPLICTRVRQAVATWSNTGEIPGLPSGVAIPSPASFGSRMLARTGRIGRSLAGGIRRLTSGLRRLFFKSRAGGPRMPASPRAIQSQLNSGSPLDSGLKSRMQAAMGVDFSQVRVHADTTGAKLSDEINARAFTIGNDIAFGTGEYRPGSLDGDALIAHELAHVLQQGGGQTSAVQQKNETESAGLEEDADRTAVQAVVDLWGGNAIPVRAGGSRFSRLRSGLRLQRCGASEPDFAPSRSMPAPSEIAAGFAEEEAGLHEFIHYDTETNSYNARFDGDGDQQRELIVRLKELAETDYGNPTRVEMELEQISSQAKQKHEFSVPPRVLGAGVRFNPGLVYMTNGRDPTRIRLTSVGAGPETMARIYPPQRRADSVTYRAEVEEQTADYLFPAEQNALFNVFQTDNPRQVGPIHTIDMGIGVYRDRFRLTFTKENPNNNRVILGLSPLGPEGPLSGRTIDLSVSGDLNVHVLRGNAANLSIDLNGDRQSDLEVWDHLRAMRDSSSQIQPLQPARFRTHQISFSGSAMGGRRRMLHYEIREGELLTGGGSTARDFPAASQAQAVESLAEAVGSGGFYDQVSAIEARRMAIRQEAANEGVIGHETFGTWRSLSEAVANLQLEQGQVENAREQGSQGEVSQERRSQVESRARAFYTAFAAETRDQRETIDYGQGYSEDVNPYTGADYTYNYDRGAAQEYPVPTRLNSMLRSLEQQNYNGVVFSYRLFVDGLDRWIIHQLRQRQGRSSRDAKIMEALVAQSRALDRIERHNPTRVWAVLHPRGPFAQTGHATGVPLYLYYWKEDDEWHLADLTKPSEPFEPTMPATADQTEPPRAMFQRLNDEDHLPENSIIYYQLPSGTSGRVVVNEGLTWEEFFTWLGVGLAAIGITLVAVGTAGSAVAVAGGYFLAASGVAGGIAAGIDLYHHSQQGSLTAGRITLDLAQIVGGFAGAASIVSGKVVMGARLAQARGAPLRSWRARVANLADPVVIPASIAAAGADVVNFAVVAGRTLNQLQAVHSGPGSASDKARAWLILLSNLAVSGGMVALSVKGTVEGFTPGRSIYLDYVHGVPVARATGLSHAGREIHGARPDISPTTTAARFREQTSDHLDRIRQNLPGEAGQNLAHVDELAMSGAWHHEQSLRVLDPVFEGVSPELRRITDRTVKDAVRRHQRRFADIMNDPTMDISARRTALRNELDDLERTLANHPEARRAIPFEQTRARIDALEDSTGSLLTVTGYGQLMRSGQPAGNMNDLMEQVVRANNTNAAHGIELEYVVAILPSPRPGAPAPVHVLPRRSPRLGSTPAGVSGPLPDLPPNTEGIYAVDVGVGTSGYGIDMTPRSDRALAPLVQTDVDRFVLLSQTRRKHSIDAINPREAHGGSAPRYDERAMLIYGDTLQNLPLIFGRPSEGRGVRRLLINNVPAGYTPGDSNYETLARGLGESVGRGGRVEIQWDTSLEVTRGVSKPRGHITGDDLLDAIRQHSGRSVRPVPESGIPYPYSINPSASSGGTSLPSGQRPRDPDPTSETGRRLIIEFLD